MSMTALRTHSPIFANCVTVLVRILTTSSCRLDDDEDKGVAGGRLVEHDGVASDETLGFFGETDGLSVARVRRLPSS